MELPESLPNGPALVLAPVGRDASVICGMLRDAGLEALQQASLSELTCNLNNAASAVIAQEALIHEDRSALARWIADQPPWSDFPFVLLTLRAAQNSPALPDLIELLGNVTILERPLAATSLKSAVRAALRGRTRQRQAGQYLEQLKALANTLEQRVIERTQQLSDANSRLMREMAEHERTELALRHAQKMEAVGQLTGGIAHDFNNLLMTIMGSLELMELRLNDERMQRYARNAMHAAQRGAKLVDQLLAFSRKQHLVPEPVDINELVSTVVELLSRTIGTGIRVDLVTQKDLWPALVDATQLELMLLNLAFNARDAMPEGGILTIETAGVEHIPYELRGELEGGQYVSIAVRDTGTGMTPEVLARAFDPFFTTKTPGKGTGLGLSQVYGFARQSGGTVKIVSQLGKGTEVFIFLPRSAKSAGAKQAEHMRRAGTAGKETVLVVDDDAAVLETARGMLDALGYSVIAAPNAEAALDAVDGDAIDIAIVDVAMPGLSGIDLGVRMQERKPGLAIVFCSGYADLIAANEKQMNSDRFLRKPYSSRELSAKIEASLRAARSAAPVASSRSDVH